jgi:plastocyanin
MKKILKTGSGFGLLVVFFLAGCAGQKPVTIERGQKTIQMKASDFTFEPNLLKAQKGEVINIQVENVSGTTHNLTVKNPEGKLLADIDIPPKGTATAKVNFTESGTYPFYCNKTLHSTMGMKGRIEVSP